MERVRSTGIFPNDEISAYVLVSDPQIKISFLWSDLILTMLHKDQESRPS